MAKVSYLEKGIGKKRYIQKYRKEWETMDKFSGWLTKCKLDDSYGYCKACRKNILGRLASLKEHAASTKHKRNLSIFNCNPKVETEEEEQEPPPSRRKIMLDHDDNKSGYYMMVEGGHDDEDNHITHRDRSDMESSRNEVENPLVRESYKKDDEYDAIGFNVAAKLRRLPSPNNIIAEKLIGDVLFQAQIGALSHETTLFTPVRQEAEPQRVMQESVVPDQAHVVQYQHSTPGQVCLTIARTD